PAATGAPAATSAPAATAVPQGPKEIVMGAALPLTGGQAREGGFFKKSYEMAVKEINDAGGIMVKEYNRKIPIKLIIYDDKSETTTSVTLYEKLATEDKVDVFLGGYSTALVQAHVIVPQKYQIPYVNGGGATGSIYAQGNKWIFGLLASIEKLSITFADWIEIQQDAGALPKPVKIAMAAENTSHGVEFAKGINERAKAKPDRFTIVMDEKFEINGKDYAPLIAKVKAANADVFFADARVADYTLMHRQYTEAGLSHKVVSYGPRGPESAARTALGAASDYIVAANW
ncbi:MAG: amino acid ABC transporter substrate-binding protein, partial [Chloroflexi bacterium]|nr:amino acid ABC transporter substrate-binding protein [Chloroflexota bacterium]